MNNEAIKTLVARWAEPDGVPFKCALIDENGCMCAQGQALHYIGGWTLDRLRCADQEEADREVARLLGISTTHAVLLRAVNDNRPGAPSIVLTNPELVIGDQAQVVLAFWRHLDGMMPEQWAAASAADAAAGWDAAAAAAAAGAAAGAAAAGWAAAAAAAADAAWAAARATAEIQGAAVMRERGQPFFFLPMFGFENPESIPL